MHRSKYTQIISRFLLSVYMMMLIVSAFHVHECDDEEIVCIDCINHVKHPGHLTSHNHDIGDCVVCKVIFSSYTPAKSAVEVFIVAIAFLSFSGKPQKASFQHIRAISLRAPPFFG